MPRFPNPIVFYLLDSERCLRRVWHSNPSQYQTQSPHPFNALTLEEQTQHLQQLAQVALGHYGVAAPELDLIHHGDNTVFRVTASDQQFALRIHRSHYLAAGAIAAELRWLQYLSQNTSLQVPEPVLTPAGELVVTLHIPALPDPRTCSLVQWLAGAPPRFDPLAPDAVSLQLEAIGRVLGQLHHQAGQWSPPQPFTRPHWHWQGLLGSGAGYSNDGAWLWQQLPAGYQALFAHVSDRARTLMQTWDNDSTQWGLIHGDFWRGNLLVTETSIPEQPYGVIDFADCGWGYWGYDVARFLGDVAPLSELVTYLKPLLAGYETIRPFPAAQLPAIPLLMAVQEVSFALWRLNRAQEHPSFRATLDEDLRAAAAAIEQILALEV